MATVLINQFIVLVESYNGQPIFPASLELQYNAAGMEKKQLGGRVREGLYRAQSVFDNALTLSALLCITLPLCLSLMALAKVTLVRVLSMLTVLLALPVVFLTGSRSGILVVLFIFAWMVYARLSRGFGKWGRRWLALGLGSVGVLMIYMVAGNLLQSLFFGEVYVNSTNARLLGYIAVPALLVDSPLFGFGYSRHIVAQLEPGQPLDPFLFVIALEGGVVAVAAFFFFMYKASLLLQPIVLGAAGEVEDARLALGLRLSMGVSIILMLALGLSFVRMYIFLAAGMAIALHHMVQKQMVGKENSGVG